MKEQGRLIRWIRKHKKALIIAGISIGVIIAAVLDIRSRKKLHEMWISLKNVVEKKTSPVVKSVPIETVKPVEEEAITILTECSDTRPVFVHKHPRNLPSGQKPSFQKINTALENGFDNLAEGQTWVNDYVKGAAA